MSAVRRLHTGEMPAEGRRNFNQPPLFRSLNDCHPFFCLLLMAVFLVGLVCLPPAASAVVCNEDQGLPLGPGSGEDLEVTGPCTVNEGQTYHYRDVNIYNGGSLTFGDPAPGKGIHFWARSILVEKDSSLEAGKPGLPIGTNCQATKSGEQNCRGLVTFHLYGEDTSNVPFNHPAGTGGSGITCKTDVHCGVPDTIWKTDPTGPSKLPGEVTDYFYAYQPLPYDDGDPYGYFGYKVLAVSYGGTLKLFGKKGATTDAEAGPVPSDSGTSWVRLSKTLNPGDTKLFLDRKVDPDWEVGDQIVVTTTDYLPGHSEQLEICGVDKDNNIVTVQRPHLVSPPPCGTDTQAVKYIHNGVPYDLSDTKHPGIDRLKLDIKVEAKPAAETRAAVALLSRSIRIVSEGNELDQPLPSPSTPGTEKYFGGHTLVRQGVMLYQVQGVEFFQLGQGGRMGHYPVHFHETRKTPAGTFVKDCSIHDSMTRFITLHATQGVTLARNVGYLSIGHGFYLEDGTEIDNKLYSNIGIFARAAIANDQNPRSVPGILAGGSPAVSDFPYNSDFSQPTVFWIMNGWNDFQYNMAAGAGACGVCYWLVPGANSGWSKDKKWESYASMQKGEARAATTPLKLFRGNYCTTAMNSFNTVGGTDTCLGLVELGPVPNTLVPAPTRNETDTYYPITAGFGGGGGRFPTRCDAADCSTVPKCANGATENCMVTVLDRYTSSFHWAQFNFAAIWLRPQWYLVTNSVLSDVQNAGLTFVTGGDYTGSNFIPGQWMLARKNAFIGNSQDNESNPYASHAGPFNPDGLECGAGPLDRCYSKAEGISMPLSGFANFQHLFSIYDGPAYQETNAYLDITKTSITDCPSPNVNQQCNDSKWMYGKVLGMRNDDANHNCYLPNAAIGWKQPNGFFYPPAFHSTNLFFDNVDIRHFVIEPQFIPGTFKTQNANNYELLKKLYCTWNPAMFDNFSDIDRQTELNDDDGSLTGLVKTISVNEDSFFNAPVETFECESDKTAKTSPYDYVTTVVYPDCAAQGSTSSCLADPEQPWDSACSNQNCYGVPLFRQYKNQGEEPGLAQEIRMAGMNFSQRSNLTVNHGLYYIDTNVGTSKQAKGVDCKKNPKITVDIDCTDPKIIAQKVGDFPNNVDPNAPDAAAQRAQRACECDLNVFRGGQSYYVFFLYAKPDTRQTYQVYVGEGLNQADVLKDVKLVRADISGGNVLPFASEDFPNTPGYSHPWSREYDKDFGILTVGIDLRDFESEFASVQKTLCQPKSFCSWNETKSECECNKELNNPQSALYNPTLYNDCIETTGTEGRTICSWAGNDIDCPDGRCFGFSFKLPDKFTADSTDQRPTLENFLRVDWCTNWLTADMSLAGSCYYMDPPPKPPLCKLFGSLPPLPPPLLYSDVPSDYWAYSYINTISKLGITNGCGNGFYCPEEFATRAEAAVFIERAISGGSYMPPAATGIFVDVPTTFWAADWIEQSYQDGISFGCNADPLQYCPEQMLTRAEMAILLLRAKYGSDYSPPPATGIFLDVPTDYWAADWIEELYLEDITIGCSDSPLMFCPDDWVTRAQMAAFLVRTFDL